ncbi:hypothetical protein J2S43_000170 [Catenuloplanes nepalensis]|uniref:NADH dehydrogenase subunit 6 n=1 Tax=Catenuloplanes nepalensis TaxID=587533 RepID=A0ABT9MK46_9ACTN|nr:hypothetical protein [Catenuloplanes nepalensis]
MGYDMPGWLGWVIAGVGVLVLAASAILLA